MSAVSKHRPSHRDENVDGQFSQSASMTSQMVNWILRPEKGGPYKFESDSMPTPTTKERSLILPNNHAMTLRVNDNANKAPSLRVQPKQNDMDTTLRVEHQHTTVKSHRQPTNNNNNPEMATSSSTSYQTYGDDEELQAATIGAGDEVGRRQQRWFNKNRPTRKANAPRGGSSSKDGLLGKQSGETAGTIDERGVDQDALIEATDSLEVYIVRQRYGYASIGFSIVQTVILIVMMVQCGIAPLNINPMVGPYPHVLSEWGGKNTTLILEDGEWWRLITPIFLHAGVIHLIGNIMVQIETGVFFEREWGTFRWLIIYLVSAVGSSALSVIFMPDAISVGSSGAVMGLFGGKAAEVICRCCERSEQKHEQIAHTVRKEQCAGVICSVTIVMLFSFIPFVDWAAHLGGLIGGFCIGMILFSINLQKALFSKLTWLFVGIGITAAYFIVLFHRMYSQEINAAEELRDVCGYYQQYFQDYECTCQRQGQN